MKYINQLNTNKNEQFRQSNEGIVRTSNDLTNYRVTNVVREDNL